MRRQVIEPLTTCVSSILSRHEAYNLPRESSVLSCRAMRLVDFAFQTTDWSAVDSTHHPGDAGFATWRTQRFGDVRVRMVEYSPGYLADHWCSKGHVLLCLEGELHTELADGRSFVLRPGMSYQVADDAEAHRSSAPSGARLFIVD